MITGQFEADDGVLLAFERFPAAGDRHALFLHATGLCKETWRPVVRALEAEGTPPTITAVDQRAHGESGVPSPPYPWTALGADAAAAVRHCDRPLIGVGHSSGGAALCMAEADAPGSFAALVLIEPVVFPPPYVRSDDNPLTLGALRRRSSFASREEARQNFSAAGPFARWTPEALDEYVEHGFRDDDGRRVLKCSPQAEAEFYREGIAHDTWDRLPAVSCPVVVLGGEDSVTHPPPVIERLASRFPHATTTIVPGANHFVPMERPDAVAAAIRAVLR